MDKVCGFGKVLDALHDDEKDKLLLSARYLIKAQKTVKAGNPSIKGKKVQFTDDYHDKPTAERRNPA